MSSSRAVQIYDTTLRDGMQQEGMSVSVDEKIRIAHKLDELGVRFIEGGFPASNPKEIAFFKRMEEEHLVNAELVAFGMTRRRGVRADGDANLRALVDCHAGIIAVVGKSSALQVRAVLRAEREENLRMIEESIAFLRAEGKRVVFDAEHFFDGFADDPEYAIETAQVAAAAGAETICLCDTNGGSLPTDVACAVAEVVAAVPARIGIHCHNDSDCAVANSLAAVAAGADQVQGTVNGYGERCGNANLISIIPALALKMELPVVTPPQLELLRETAHFVAEIVNVTISSHAPYVGRSAFAHKGGLHVAAVQRDSRTFEHIDPLLVGNGQRVVISELSGKGAIQRKVKEVGLEVGDDDERLAAVLQRLKAREHEGYHYEAADASFELLLRNEFAPHKPLFKLESFRVITEKREDGKAMIEATIKVHVNGDRLISTAEGNGPVNALDKALRQALMSKYPRLEEISLVNFRVRILDENKGTGAVTRVLLDASDGQNSWGSIGVSQNVIEASWEALVDSIEYGMLQLETK